MHISYDFNGEQTLIFHLWVYFLITEQVIYIIKNNAHAQVFIAYVSPYPAPKEKRGQGTATRWLKSSKLIKMI